MNSNKKKKKINRKQIIYNQKKFNKIYKIKINPQIKK